MADTKVDFLFTTTLTQREFSIMTRLLAGHQLKDNEVKTAREMNVRLLRQRVGQMETFTRSARQARDNALTEIASLRDGDSEQCSFCASGFGTNLSCPKHGVKGESR